MIIGPDRTETEMVTVEQFVAGLRRAARAVVYVTASSAASGHLGRRTVRCTGWLLTDTLVVVPDYAVFSPEPTPSPRIYCTASVDGDGEVEAARIGEPAPSLGDAPALLRLGAPLPGRHLPFSTAECAAGDRVFLVHHPEGRPEARPEARLSAGQIVSLAGPWIGHDANTLPGSGGAPVLDERGAVVAMHMKGAQSANHNEALSLHAILDALRKAPAWREIADAHGLADVDAARAAIKSRLPVPVPAREAQGRLPAAKYLAGPTRGDPTRGDPAAAPADLPPAALRRAAVRWNFDARELSPDDAALLRPLVANPATRMWALRPAERERIVRAIGSLDALRDALHDAPDSVSSNAPHKRAIARILQGPPYDLRDVPEWDLPFWLQAVRWYAPVVDELPSAAEVNEELERRRVRSRLRAVAGPDFRGRVAELDRLAAWYADDAAGPVVVTGIGGVGKSALVSRFALARPPETLLLWLDFDRADLAPDDAVSVLTLLGEQATVQRPGFPPPAADPDTWAAAAAAFGRELARTEANRPPPLLVLDGFEIAQHAERHQEIWDVLQQLVTRCPALRVLVSGRAPVAHLKLGGRDATVLPPLEGIEPSVAAQWLRERGIDDDAVVTRVLQITHRVPLKLAMAVQYVTAGGAVESLLAELPKRLVDGFLYQRVLDRVVDDRLRSLARAALILRRLTAKLIREMLADQLPEGVDADVAFAQLAREMSLVLERTGGVAAAAAAAAAGTALTLRPEVRAAVLRLLEAEDAAFVAEIDRRAAAWYERQAPDQPTDAAELVYHRLRLNDVAGAALAWRDDCAPLLKHAADELPESADAARDWLLNRGGGGAPGADNLRAWELDAVARIRAALGRGLSRAVGSIRGERPDRTPDSPLTVYDAWARYQSGDLAGARDILRNVPPAAATTARDRAVVAAFLAARTNDRPAADELLAAVQDPSRWSQHPDPELMGLAVWAARVRLTVDLDAEVDLVAKLQPEPQGPLLATLERFLTPFDVMLPSLSTILGRERLYGLESVSLGTPPQVPEADADGPRFRRELLAMRRMLLAGSAPDPFAAALDPTAPKPWPWHASELSAIDRALFGDPAGASGGGGVDVGLDLGVLAARRWGLAASGPFLACAFERLIGAKAPGDPTELAVTATLAAFRGNEQGSLSLWYRDRPLKTEWTADVLIAQRDLFPPVSPGRVELAARVAGGEGGLRRLRGDLGLLLNAGLTPDPYRVAATLLARPGLVALSVFLLGPDPLEMLVRRVVGLPDKLVV